MSLNNNQNLFMMLCGFLNWVLSGYKLYLYYNKLLILLHFYILAEIKELIDQFDIDCLVLTHSSKPSSNDSDDPFDKIIGSTALQGVQDNLMVLEQSKGQTKLHTKGRLIYPSEKVLNFEGGRYEERAGASAEYEDKAPVQALVLEELEKAPKTVKELSDTLSKDKGQISNVCSSLAYDGMISRSNRTAPWCLVETSFKT